MPTSLQGIGVSAGLVAGPVAKLAAPPALPAPRPVQDAAAEAAAARAALQAVTDDLFARSAAAADPVAKGVLEAQAMMAADPTLADAVAERIEGGVDGPHAVEEAFAGHRAQLESLGGYFAERVSDLDDVKMRVVCALLGLPMPGVPSPGHPFVLVAADLAPADTATLDPAEVLAILTERGGPTGHTAILAKQLGIPAVTACAGALALTDDQTVLVDGQTGLITPDPSDEQVAAAKERQAALAARRASSHGPGRTADGHPVRLLVNIGGPSDVQASGVPGAQGVGLFRTEFLFLDRQTAPTAAEQQELYAQVFAPFAGRAVIVRTLDVGADKPLPYLAQEAEENPALGVRGLRLGRVQPAVLEEQLAAIAAAARASDADVSVMAPMVSTAREAREFAEIARSHGIEKVGVMIEVPAAALLAEQVLAEVDFASIGTNDLAQYTMAADRMEGRLADLLDPWQPAVLALIQMVAAAGQKLGKSVGVCGEAASDPGLALVLAGMGVTSLSMSPGALADVRGTLAAHTLEDCQRLAAAAVGAPSAPDGRAAINAELIGVG
ncbi:MAG: phosphoenolpyruvate--protein phosphotransferase [Solirubrobacteraceae bacterium]|nr:phosphoenolpyruvate--protein phosphotransferase [Solirubrobacteraceae bacterium]